MRSIRAIRAEERRPTPDDPGALIEVRAAAAAAVLPPGTTQVGVPFNFTTDGLTITGGLSTLVNGSEVAVAVACLKIW